MKTRRAVGMAALIAATLANASCTSLTQEQMINNDQTRLAQQLRGYPDREDSREQKRADERAYQEQLREKASK